MYKKNTELFGSSENLLGIFSSLFAEVKTREGARLFESQTLHQSVTRKDVLPSSYGSTIAGSLETNSIF